MASKRCLRRKACSRKRRYLDATSAHAAAANARRITGELITAYGCRFCGGFHIGHPPVRVRQAIADRRRNG